MVKQYYSFTLMGMRTLFVTLALVVWQLSFAQGFKVKEFKQNLNDGSAFHAPLDAEGCPCGLIKVRTDNSDLIFKGSIVGDVENKMNEYWVYVSQRSALLNICHPNYMPLVIPFSNYGIEISSKATYVLTLEETKYKKEKTGLTIVVKPEKTDLYIDDIFIDNMSGNGFYQLYLPKGEHVCKLSKTGYRPNVQIVQTGKASHNISVELESVMAELEVKCKSGISEIYVDGELKGNGVWKGEILAGEHEIEARQQNFNTHTQRVILSEKEKRTITIPQLKRSMGKIQIETRPTNMPIVVDGKSFGNSPCSIELETGKHYVECKSYGCITARTEVEVISEEQKKVTLDIQYSNDDWLKDDYQGAYRGNEISILNLICQKCRAGEYKETFFWVNRHPDKEKVVFNWEEYGPKTNCGWWQCYWIEAYSYAGMPEKALQLFPIQQRKEELFSADLNMSYIGKGFYMKKEYEKAISCFEKAEKYGYEGLGDCYLAKGDKQRAVIFYKKCLSIDDYDVKNRVEKKLKEIGY